MLTDGDTLVIAEVRYRRCAQPVHPAETITPAKQRRLARAALHYLQRNPRAADRPLRFDLVSLSGPPQRARLEWLKNIFQFDDPGNW